MTQIRKLADCRRADYSEMQAPLVPVALAFETLRTIKKEQDVKLRELSERTSRRLSELVRGAVKRCA